MNKLKIASFFAGVGGIDLGFENTGFFKTIYANEIDPAPVNTYQLNFTDVTVDNRDINNVLAKDVPDVDIIVGGFPCQAFSIAGYQQGFQDEKGRGLLFFELMRIAKEKQPKVIFLENVKNLKSHNKGQTLETILKTLTNIGYYYTYAILNASKIGNIPQNRERIYIIAFKDKNQLQKFKMPKSTTLKTKLSDVIDFKNPVDEKYYYKPNRCKDTIYQKIVANVTSQNSVYQWRRQYVRENQSGLIPTLTANMGGGGHNVPIILSDTGIRKLTPKECFNAQGFPTNFKLPNLCDSKLYKQAGNSVCVTVIERIAENIYNAII